MIRETKDKNLTLELSTIRYGLRTATGQRHGWEYSFFSLFIHLFNSYWEYDVPSNVPDNGDAKRTKHHGTV